jgi:sugar/nucleoside kinase (ribokinase family)
MKRKALFFGLTTVDIQYFIEKFPESNQKIKTQEPLVHPGGPSANAAITFSFFNGESTFVTYIGKNPFTSLIQDDFCKNGIQVIDLVENKPFDPIFATILTTLDNGDRTIISHFPSETKNSLTDLESLINFSEYEVLFIDGFYPETTLQICKLAKQHNLQVIFDGGSWKPGIEPLLNYVDIAICSENFIPPKCIDYNDVIPFLKQYEINNIAITRGEKSIKWIEDDEIHSIEIPQINSVDSLGAGDIFHGAFTWFYLNNYPLGESLVEAGKIASESTLYRGTRQWMTKKIEI